MKNRTPNQAQELQLQAYSIRPEIVLSCVGDRIHERTKESLEEALMEWVPTGNKCTVVREALSEKIGKLYRPAASSPRFEVKATGWVIAVGPFVGRMPMSGVSRPGYVGPNTGLLGRRIVFGVNALGPLQITERDDATWTQIGMLYDVDIWYIGTKDRIESKVELVSASAIPQGGGNGNPGHS